MIATASLREIHEGFAWFMIIGNGMAGAWSLAAHWVPSLRTRSLWWFVVAVEVAIFAQVTMGAVLIADQNFTAPRFHLFYGFIATFVVTILYGYRQQLAVHRYLLYGGGGLFLMGLGIRAMLVFK